MTESATLLPKGEHLHIRATSEEKVALAEAARLTHQNLSQFVLTTALEAAHEVIARENVLRLSPDAYEAFVRRLNEPARDIPALREQFQKAGVFRGE